MDHAFIPDNFYLEEVKVDDRLHFIFATPDGMETLPKAKRWYMDGNIKHCTSPFIPPADNPCIHNICRRHETGPTGVYPDVRKTEDRLCLGFRTSKIIFIYKIVYCWQWHIIIHIGLSFRYSWFFRTTCQDNPKLTAKLLILRRVSGKSSPPQ